MTGVDAIYNVPQNKAIQGDDPNTGLIPGDTILIPNAQGAPAGGPASPLPNAPSNVLPPVIIPGSPVSNNTTPTGAPTNATFWTTPKIVLAAGAGVAGLGLIGYLVMRKKRR